MARFPQFKRAFHGARDGHYSDEPIWGLAGRHGIRLNQQMRHDIIEEDPNLGPHMRPLTRVESIVPALHNDYTHIVEYSHRFEGAPHVQRTKWGLGGPNPINLSVPNDIEPFKGTPPRLHRTTGFTPNQTLFGEN